MPEKVCSERFFLLNPQSNVEKLWNRILLLLKEAIPTILPKRWAHISPWMDKQIEEVLGKEVYEGIPEAGVSICLLIVYYYRYLSLIE